MVIKNKTALVKLIVGFVSKLCLKYCQHNSQCYRAIKVQTHHRKEYNHIHAVEGEVLSSEHLKDWLQ